MLRAVLKEAGLSVPFILLILIASSRKYLLYDINDREIVAVQNSGNWPRCSAQRPGDIRERGAFGTFLSQPPWARAGEASPASPENSDEPRAEGHAARALRPLVARLRGGVFLTPLGLEMSCPGVSQV